MTPPPKDIGKRVQDLTVRFGAEAMRSLQRYHELLQRVASGELEEADVSREYVRFVRDESQRYLHGVADLSAAYYDALLELAAVYNPPFFEHAVERPRPGVEPSSTGRRVVELDGVLGEEAASTFQVVNTSADTSEVTFVVAEFTGPPGTAPFRPPLRLQPARFALKRFESQVVSVRLPLLATLFVPHQRYTTSVAVRSSDPFELTVVVYARPAPAAVLRPLGVEAGPA